ncbi:glutamate receptor ionotropic, delta-1 [Andrena cerasifolii]|uniref:glutamate receptor ionotropic, delta-1 n=1 Tax=Andrena cerasifolii TaxID=2819439 RepID=UPI004037F709
MQASSFLRTFPLLLFHVLANKNDIRVPRAGPWISDDNFTTIVKSSFPVSRCCSVFLSDSIEDSGLIFRQFRSVYPYEYLLGKSAHECDGYFLLGANAEELEKLMDKVSPMWKTEVLVIVDNYVPNHSNVFNESIYGLANVNIVSLSGNWRLSENYIKPRVFIELDSYEERERTNDSPNMRGRELKACSIYRPPMTYLNRTVNKTIDGVRVEVFAVDDDLEGDGIEMQLFKIMAEKLNFTWTIRRPEGNETYGRRISETVWKGGMIEMLRENKADVAFASIWITHDQNTFVHLSEPWYQLYIHFLVPRPRRTTNFWALVRPFSRQVWCLLVATVLLHSLYTYSRAWIDTKYPKRFRNFLITLIDLIGFLLSSSVPSATESNKIQVLLWRTAGWLIIAAYCSSLAARLASSEYEERIDTVEQFLAANLTWGRKGQVPSFRDYFDLTNQYSAQLPRRYRYLENDTQWKTYMKQGNYAILGKIVDTCFFPDDYIENEDLKNYRLMKEPVGRFYAAFALQSWLLKPVNTVMLRLKEAGITIWHLRDVIRRRDSYNLRQVLIEHDGYDGSVQVLGLTPLAAGFSLLLIGATIAVLVFHLELTRAARSTSIRDVLRSIASNRRSTAEKVERHRDDPKRDVPNMFSSRFPAPMD